MLFTMMPFYMAWRITSPRSTLLPWWFSSPTLLFIMVLFYIAWFDLLCIAVVQHSGSAGWSREPQLDGCIASGSWCHDALRPAAYGRLLPALWLALRDAGNAWYTASARSQGLASPG
jgi:hypothetical protein